MQRVYMRIGEILVRHGVINLEQMHEALCRQRVNFKRLGDVLIDGGMATMSQVNAAMVEQAWRCGQDEVQEEKGN